MSEMSRSSSCVESTTDSIIAERFPSPEMNHLMEISIRGFVTLIGIVQDQISEVDMVTSLPDHDQNGSISSLIRSM